MKQWEYLILERHRGWYTQGSEPHFRATAWDRDIYAELPALGTQGWELVNISAQSGVLGAWRENWRVHPVLDFAGFTDAEVWVFKRPLGEEHLRPLSR